MPLFLKGIYHHREENVTAAEQRNILNDIVNLGMKTLTKASRKKPERRKSIFHVDYATLERFIMVQFNPQ